jgi:hypothetical protein
MILLLPLMVSLASSPGDAAPWQPTGQNVHGNDAPAAVAELVADAIAANRFWVFTDPPFTQIALDRWQSIAEGTIPRSRVDAPGMPPAKELVAEIRQLLAGPGGAL